jgi:hypothetical protein
VGKLCVFVYLKRKTTDALPSTSRNEERLTRIGAQGSTVGKPVIKKVQPQVPCTGSVIQ